MYLNNSCVSVGFGINLQQTKNDYGVAMHTLKDLLDVAIQGEVNSQKLYQRGVEVAGDDEIRAFFKRLVKEETMHENMLFNIRETELYDLSVKVDDPDLFEAARSSHGSANIAFDENWTTEDILNAAMTREFNAMKRYKAAADATANLELKTLFSNLSEEESHHHRVVEHQYNLLKGLAGKEL